MSQLHTADLTRRIGDLLARRAPPRSFADNASAKSDQLSAYVGILRRFAPEGDRLDDWWDAFTVDLGQRAETWAWPSEADVAKAAKAASSGTRDKSGEGWKPDSIAINAGRIARGEPVGVDWLWGKLALRLMAEGGVGRTAIHDRRAVHVQGLHDLYGAKADAMIEELDARHRAAEETRDDWQRGRSAPAIPNKRHVEAAE